MDKKKRSDFILNKTKIMSALKELMLRTGRKPTMDEIAMESGVNKRTVKRHMQNYRDENYMKDFQVLTDEIIIALYQKAKEGRAAEVKLWLQLVEKWKETQGIEHSGNVEFDEKIQFVLFSEKEELQAEELHAKEQSS